MKKLTGLFAVLLILAVAAFAQREGGGQHPAGGGRQAAAPAHVGGGYIPSRGPAPSRGSAKVQHGDAAGGGARASYRDQEGHP